jgi:hypothetical protein
MFEDIQGWKAQGGLGGALGGWSAGQQAIEGQNRVRDQDMAYLINRLNYDREQQRQPLFDAQLQNNTDIEALKTGQIRSGKTGELMDAELDAGITGARAKVKANELAESEAKAKFWLATAEMLDAQKDNPAMGAGAGGWEQFRSAAKELKIDSFPEADTPEGRAHIYNRANFAKGLMPVFQQLKTDTQRNAWVDHRQHQGFAHDRDMQRTDQTFRGNQQSQEIDFRRGEGSADRANRLQIARIAESGANTRAAAGKASLGDKPGGTLERAKQVWDEKGIGAVSHAGLALLETEIIDKIGPDRWKDVENTFTALKATTDPKEKAKLEKKLAEDLGEQYLAVKAEQLKRKGGSTEPTPEKPKSSDPRSDSGKISNTPVKVKTQAEVDALPSGTVVELPNGKRMRKK